MAKKKNVDIKRVPLESITVGKIKQNKHSWIFMIVLFSLFIAFIYFLPNINNYYSKILSILGLASSVNDDINNEENAIDNSNSELKEKYYIIDDNTNFNLSDLSFSNFIYKDKILTFNISNSSANDISLQDKNLFLQIYDDENNLISWYMLEGNVESGSSLLLNLDINEQIVNFNILEVTEYPDFAIEEKDNNESIITCVKDEEVIVYTFVDKKLNKVSYDLKFDTSSVKYSYSTYFNLFNQHKNTDGLKVNIISSSISVNYTMLVDYNVYNDSLNEFYFFRKNESINKVNYIMKSLSYKCS